jgi:hypothetical protein
MVLAVVFLLLAVWERPNLRAWSRGERAAFWVCWGVALAWALALNSHLSLPTGPALIQAIFRHAAQRYLTPVPDVYW